MVKGTDKPVASKTDQGPFVKTSVITTHTIFFFGADSKTERGLYLTYVSSDGFPIGVKRCVRDAEFSKFVTGRYPAILVMIKDWDGEDFSEPIMLRLGNKNASLVISRTEIKISDMAASAFKRSDKCPSFVAEGVLNDIYVINMVEAPEDEESLLIDESNFSDKPKMRFEVKKEEFEEKKRAKKAEDDRKKGKSTDKSSSKDNETHLSTDKVDQSIKTMKNAQKSKKTKEKEECSDSEPEQKKTKKKAKKPKAEPDPKGESEDEKDVQDRIDKERMKNKMKEEEERKKKLESDNEDKDGKRKMKKVVLKKEESVEETASEDSESDSEEDEEIPEKEVPRKLKKPNKDEPKV